MSNKPQYQREYRKKNKKSILKKQNKYRKEKRKSDSEFRKKDTEASKQFYYKNRKAQNLRSKKYRKNNQELIKELSKKNYLKNKEQILERQKNNAEKAKTKWIIVLKENDRLRCLLCGYDEDFSAIDLHHFDSETKIHAPSTLLRRNPTKKNIEYIINNTVSLCANCHRLLHNNKLNNFILEKEEVFYG